MNWLGWIKRHGEISPRIFRRTKAEDLYSKGLVLDPRIIICDECVSALDVSIQAQIINLLVKLQKQLGLTLIFISHDLRVVRHISTKVAVMYLGKIVEYSSVDELFDNPLHPYTKALISAVPVDDPDGEKKRIILTGDIPSPIDVPAGCSFSTRCSIVKDECLTDSPVMKEVKRVILSVQVGIG